MYTNPFNLPRGALCVLRYHCTDGKLQLSAFAVAPRANWREWSGTFSLL